MGTQEDPHTLREREHPPDSCDPAQKRDEVERRSRPVAASQRKEAPQGERGASQITRDLGIGDVSVNTPDDSAAALRKHEFELRDATRKQAPHSKE